MIRFLIYIFTLCLFTISCSHSYKKPMATLDPLAPPPDLAPPEVPHFTQRGISAEPVSLEGAYSKLKTADELDALIASLDKNYSSYADNEKLLAIELTLLRSLRGLNGTLNQMSIGMTGATLLKMVSGFDITNIRKGSVLESYLTDKKVRRFTARGDAPNHFAVQFGRDTHIAFIRLSALTSKVYKSDLCLLPCDGNRMVSRLKALETLALINAKINFQSVYKYTDIFDVRKSLKTNPGAEQLDTDPSILNAPHTEADLKEKTREVLTLYLFRIGPYASDWLKRSFDWYKIYIAYLIANDSKKANLKQVFMKEFQVSYQNKPITIYLPALFDKPNDDLRNFLPTKFDEKSKKPLEWDLDSYRPIFPSVRSHDEIPIHINALSENFPGGLPFPLQFIFKSTNGSIKK